MASTEPQIESVEGGAGQALIRLIAQESLLYFAGHFDGYPLLPGVVQVKWAIELGRKHLGVSGPFREMKGVKFMRVIQPAAQLALHLRCDPQHRKIKFEYRQNDAICSLGTILFGANA